MKIYGSELRQAALSALERGETQRMVSGVFGVPVSTLARWRGEQRATGQVAPRARGHLKRAIVPEQERLLLRLLQEQPDATLEQMQAYWQAQTGQSVSRASMARAIVRLGWTRKKRA